MSYTILGALRKASAIESKCGKALDRLPDRSAGWARNCVYLAKRVQAAAEKGNTASATKWLRKLTGHLRATGHARIIAAR